MSFISKFSRHNKRRDRSKTNSGLLATLMTHRNKRPLDEINTSHPAGFKRRALSATTGNENQNCSIVFLNNREGKI